MASLDTGSLSPEFLGFLTGPTAGAGKGGSLAVGAAVAGILGGIAGAIGLGLAVQGFLG